MQNSISMGFSTVSIECSYGIAINPVAQCADDNQCGTYITRGRVPRADAGLGGQGHLPNPLQKRLFLPAQLWWETYAANHEY